ncbi:MAG: MinD/ParA family protein [Chloroflexota bacterium]|nr:MinD/ParA family protein [Chloroflexota bacterium]
MPKIISIHSFRGGTGKSNTTANIAAILAIGGKRVGVIDTDIQAPGIHVLFGVTGKEIEYSLNDYLQGHCDIVQAAHDVTANLSDGQLDDGHTARVFMIPSSMQADKIVDVLREGYDMNVLVEGLRQLIRELDLDVLLIDTHPGLNEETLFSIAISHTMLVVMRPDQQDYEGTAITIEVARALGVPRMMIAVNKTPPALDFSDVQAQVEQSYDCKVAAVLPHSDEMMQLASKGIFVLHYPDHPLTERLKALVAMLME